MLAVVCLRDSSCPFHRPAFPQTTWLLIDHLHHQTELTIVKSILTCTLLLSFMFVTCISGFSQDDQDTTTSTTSTQTTTRPAPVWQRIGNTGLPTQNWWIQFDRVGNMYISSNNPPAGGVSKSTDHG